MGGGVINFVSFSSGIFGMGARGYQLTRLVQYLLLLERRRMDTTPDRVEIYQRQKKKLKKTSILCCCVNSLYLRVFFKQCIHSVEKMQFSP